MNNKPRGLEVCPPLREIIYLTVTLFLCCNAGALLQDGDTGFHIRAGEFFLQTGSILNQDLFSFYTPAFPWIAHSWLAEVIMAWLHQIGGLAGVLFFYGVIAGWMSVGVYDLLRMRTKSIFITLIFFILISMNLWIHWFARPHMVSMLFIIFWAKGLWKFQAEGERRFLYLAPLGMMAWVNLHGGFIMGFVLFGVYLLGNVLSWAAMPAGQKNEPKAKTEFLLKVTGWMVAAALINPQGIRALIYPFQIVSNQPVMDHVLEFMSPNFHDRALWPFRILLYFLLTAFALRSARYSAVEILLCVLGLHMALYSVRYVPYFAIFAGPSISVFFQELYERLQGSIKQYLEKRNAVFDSVDQNIPRGRWAVIGTVALAGMVFSGRIQAHFDVQEFPVKAVEFITQQDLPGQVFANDEFADYLIYKLWPQYKVFAYGSNDPASVPRLKEYLRVVKLKSGWSEVLDKRHIGWVFIPNASPLAQMLSGRLDWRLIYADQVANIFVRNHPVYQRWIRVYPDVKMMPKEDDFK